MEAKLLDMTKKTIEEVLDNGINAGNLQNLGELVDIYKDIKEVECMRYKPYGNYGEYNEYGRDSYGRRGYDSKYRGQTYMDRMYNEYGRYEAGREEYNRGGSYGAKEDSLKSLEYMLESAVDFFKMLKSEAKSQEEMQMIHEYTHKIAEM